MMAPKKTDIANVFFYNKKEQTILFSNDYNSSIPAVLYLDINREQKELYFEEHNNVAVMFASIITDNELPDILDERELLRLMNAYITEFDIVSSCPLIFIDS